VLYGRMRPYLNKVWVAEFDGLCSAEFLVFPKHEGLNSKFLAMRLNAEDFVTFANGQVSGERPRVDFEKLSRFQILLPPIAEQERIVAKLNVALSAVQRAERSAIRAQERLQTYRAAVLRAAVSGELTCAWRESQQKNRKEKIETGDAFLQRLLVTRRARWEQSELARFRAASKTPKNDKWKSRYPNPNLPETENTPKLPHGWCWASLDQVLSVIRNGISEAPHEVNGLPVLRISAVRSMSVDLSDCRYLPASTAEKYRDYALSEGDLLFTRYNGSRNLAGVCGRVPSITRTIVYPDKLIRGVPVEIDEQLSTYLAIAANSGSSRQYIEAHLFTTAGQWGISGRNLRFTPIPLPSAVEQAHIVRETIGRLAAADRLAATLKRQLDRARAARQHLLHQAFMGRLLSQNLKDEPASVLLEHIRATRESETQKLKATHMSKSKSKMKTTGRRSLLEVLEENSGPMTPEELFLASGHSQESVDQFFAELRELTTIPPKIAEERRAEGLTQLRAVS
jgi:type I restriction enzyme S subunit